MTMAKALYKPLRCSCCNSRDGVTFGHESQQKIVLKKTKNGKTHTRVIDNQRRPAPN